MRCPKCDRLPTAVIKTERPVDEGMDNVKRRRRRCRNCRHAFFSFEIPEEEYRKLHPAQPKPEQPMEKAVRSPLKTKIKKEKEKDKEDV